MTRDQILRSEDPLHRRSTPMQGYPRLAEKVPFNSRFDRIGHGAVPIASTESPENPRRGVARTTRKTLVIGVSKVPASGYHDDRRQTPGARLVAFVSITGCA